MSQPNLGTIAHTQLMPFLTSTLPLVARRRVTLKGHGHLEIGDEGDVLFILPLLKSPLKARCRVVSNQGEDALCVIASWAQGDEAILWDLVSLSWQFARGFEHPAFKKAALPKQARHIDLSYLLGQLPQASTVTPSPGGAMSQAAPSDSRDDIDIEDDEVDDDLSGIYRMKPAPRARAPFQPRIVSPGKAPFTLGPSEGVRAPRAPRPPHAPAPEAPPGDSRSSEAREAAPVTQASPIAPPIISPPPPSVPLASPTPGAEAAPPPQAPPPEAPSSQAPPPEAPPSKAPAEESFNLKRRGLPLILADLNGSHRTGWLNVDIGLTHHRLRLEEGEVIQIEQTPGPDERILRIAAHRLDIEWSRLAPHMDAIKEVKVPEALLLEEWALSSPQASQLLKQRVQLQMTGLLPLGWSGNATFEADSPLSSPLLGEAPVLGIPLPRLIWAAMRARAQSLPRRRLESLNQKVQARSPRWVTDHTFPLSEIRASKEEEIAILAFQRNPMMSPQLVLPQGQGDQHALVVFWCLTRLGLIRVQPRG